MGSKNQPTIALSTTKYKGIVIAPCELVVLKGLLKDLNKTISNLVWVYYDNLSCIQLASYVSCMDETRRDVLVVHL